MWGSVRFRTFMPGPCMISSARQEASGEFRLFDDGSAYGTSVIHNGRLVNVPPAGGRGLRIMPGDEIYVGQARVLFETL